MTKIKANNPTRNALVEEMRARRQKENEQRLKRKKDKILKQRLITEKRNKVVKNVFDLKDKYEYYDINIDSLSRMVTLRKPLEVEYLRQFRNECYSLGFRCEIISKSMDNIYHMSEI